MERWRNPDSDLIFSLDIGTRTIIGIVGNYMLDGKFKIKAYSIREHRKRYMYDGQIHDIEGVTEIAREIKAELEEKTGTSLKKVSIAAAGRSLKTCKIRVDKEISDEAEIKRDTVEILMLEAVQKAQEIVNSNKEPNRMKYYNIGYTVINYYLDDNTMNRLEGHRGEKIGVNMLVTFLPQMVIEGLYSVISRAGLEVDNITLEPIAAINVAIKEELRLINLALVDIGAGTSDIAITKEGKIVAYAMTSLAGDEITEAISKKYLLDFNLGEKLKIGLNSKEVHSFTDIVGIEHELTTKEIVESIQETIERISDEIVDRIKEYNEKAPSAVFLIGGSSQMPSLKESIAYKLGLPKERVSIRDTDFIENLEGLSSSLKGPDIVTPIGIAIEAATQRYKNFIEVEFNGEKIRIFNIEEAKVSDILILTGYNPRDLIPRLGEDFIYYLNGEIKTITGGEGTPAGIYINNEIANLGHVLKDGDIMSVTNASKGQKKYPYLRECLPKDRIIYHDGSPFNLIRQVMINGKITFDNPLLQDGDRIEILEIKNIGEFIGCLNQKLRVSHVLLNGKKATYEEPLKAKDRVDIIEKKTIRLTINNEEKLMEHDKEKFIFVDIFDYIEFDLSRPKGRLVLRLNGRNVEYMSPLKDGDSIEIYWDEQCCN